MVTIILICFFLGYLAITLEHAIRVNKAASALLTGVLCWTVYELGHGDAHEVVHQLSEHVGEISGILFFLMGAMTIVELIDAHDGFEIIKSKITTRNHRKLLLMITVITFFLSAILDNLTTTIVMVSLMRKLLPYGQTRLLFASLIVIAANAGGAWSPIGDVTTTMLWIGGQITSANTITHLVLPSLVSVAVPLLIISAKAKGDLPILASASDPQRVMTNQKERNFVFFLGLGALIFVPVFKGITHLPPYMGMLGALGIMWIVTEFIHHGKDERDKDRFSVLYALRKIDMPSILFFMGILLAVGVLQHTGVLVELAHWLEQTVGNVSIVVILIGILSAIIDNVPLVAAAMGMYDLTQYPADHYFWLFLAYCAGTGGSLLIIGSAAGVAAMGIERITFFWYLKHVTLLALAGFLAGALTYIFITSVFG
jgi:Na+/H+ antiporter NhaD/arsenite permease-like protein